MYHGALHSPVLLLNCIENMEFEMKENGNGHGFILTSLRLNISSEE